jgi:hypothetical protein
MPSSPTLSSQTLSLGDRRLVAAWAADCAERVLWLFEREAPTDDRPREAIARARAFARGELDAAGEIRRRFVAGRAAHSATSDAGKAAARAAAQASGVAHMGAHALGAAAFTAKAVAVAASAGGGGTAGGAPDAGGTAGAGGAAGAGDPDAGRDEIAWQIGHMSGAVRIALRRLPLLGEDSSGPLGAGLLASGALGANIRAIQAALAPGGTAQES